MGGRDILKELLQKLLQSLSSKDGQSKKTIYLMIIALVALFLLLLGNSFTSKKDHSNQSDQLKLQEPLEQNEQETMKRDTSKESVGNDLESSYEEDLKKMLEKIQGVSEVDVMVNLDSTDVKIYEKDLIKGQQTTDESDNNGGIRKVEDQTEETQIVLVRQGDKEVPLLVQTKKPKVRGVFVVAKGVDQATVKMWVIEAVAKVLDVPTHKVSVMPKN